MAGESLTIRELLVRLGVDAEQGPVDRFDAGIERVRRGMAALVRLAVVVTGGIAAVTGATLAAANATAREAEEAERMAAALALSTEKAQGYRHAFEVLGLDADDVGDAFNTIADRVEDARGGMQSYIDDLALIGLTVDDLRGKDPEGLFLAFADAAAASEDVNKRNTAAVRIFGDDLGRKLLPALIGGSAAFDRLRDEAADLGLVLSGDALAAARGFREDQRRLLGVLRAVRSEFAIGVIPYLRIAAERLLDWYKANREAVRTRLADTAEKIGDAIVFVTDSLLAADRVVQSTIGGWGPIFLGVAAAAAVLVAAIGLGGLAAVLSGLVTIGSAVVGVFGALAAVLGVPALVLAGLVIAGIAVGLAQVAVIVGPVIAAFVGLALVLDDVRVFLAGGESALGKYLDQFGRAERVLESVRRLFAAIGDLGDAVVAVVGRIASAITDTLRPVIDPVLDTIDRLLARYEALLARLGARAIDFGIGGLDALSAGVSRGAAAVSGASGGSTVNAPVVVNANGLGEAEARALAQAVVAENLRHAAAIAAGGER